MALVTGLLNELSIGTIIEREGIKYRITEIQYPMVRLVRVDDSGLTFHVSELFSDTKLLDKRETVSDDNFIEPNVLETLKPHIRQEVEFKEKLALIVSEFAKAKENGTLDEFLQKHRNLFPKGTDASTLTQILVVESLAHQGNVSPSTVSRSYYKHKKFGIQGIIPKYGAGISARKDNNLLVIRNPYNHGEILQTIDVRIEDPAVIEIIQKAIERDYLRHKPNLSVSAVIMRIYAACTAKAKKKPAKSTLYKIFGKIEPRYIARFRGDKKSSKNTKM